jgi:hypothetical protein
VKVLIGKKPKKWVLYTGGFDVELAKKIELEGWKAWNLIPQKS